MTPARPPVSAVPGPAGGTPAADSPAADAPASAAAGPASVVVSDLTVSFRGGRVRALDQVSLRLAGGLTGLLGPNGAGKTTLMRVLAGVLPPTAGTVTVGGADLADRRQRQSAQAALGYLPQELGVYPDLTGRQFLDYLGRLKGLTSRPARRQRVSDVLDLVALGPVADRKLRTYSGGMKRRAGIAQAILGDPRLLIVDEPTAGLDPEERLRFRSLLAGLAGDRTVLLSTHIVDDIVQTCPQVAVVRRGTVVFQGATADLAGRAADSVWLVRRAAGTAAPDGPVVAATPEAGGTVCYRMISAAPPEPGAEPAGPTADDGYVALMHQAAG
jgi:ABC-2 type transport system ATP-binding protein